MRADHLERGTDRLGVVLVEPADDAVGVTDGDHHRAEIDALEEELVRLGERQSLALAALEEEVRVPLAMLRRAGILDADAGERDAIFFGGLANALRAA